MAAASAPARLRHEQRSAVSGAPFRAQPATFLVDQYGMKVYTYDDSRVMQACAHFKREARLPQRTRCVLRCLMR